MNGCRDDVFLSMTVEQDLLAEARVPKSRNDRTQVCGECIFIHRDCAWHPDMMIRMTAEPDRLRNCTSGLFCHCLRHARHEECIFPIAGMRSMRFRTADWNDDEIVLPQTRFHLQHGHVLEVDAVGGIHVTAAGGNLPVVFCHCY